MSLPPLLKQYCQMHSTASSHTLSLTSQRIYFANDVDETYDIPIDIDTIKIYFPRVQL